MSRFYRGLPVGVRLPGVNYLISGIVCWVGQEDLTWEVYLRDGGVGWVDTIHENDLEPILEQLRTMHEKSYQLLKRTQL